MPEVGTEEPSAAASSSSATRQRPVRTALVGVHGYGGVLLRLLQEAEERGEVKIVALADPAGPPAHGGGTAPHHPGHADLLDRHAVDLLLVAAPPHLHAEIAVDAFDRGVHVLLEKPAAPTLAEVDALIRARRSAGVLCQVGYQAQSSPAVRALRAAIDEDELGTIEGLGGAGRWQRTDAYWRRNPWAGRLVVGDRPVLDGALANPFSHLLMLTLHLAGADAATPAVPTTVYGELHRANAIESDDTSYLRVETDTGVTASLAVTLCAEQEHEPVLIVRGAQGEATLHWERDTVEVDGAFGHRVVSPPSDASGWAPDRQRAAMLTETLAAVRAGDPRQELLPAPLERARGPVQLANAALATCAGRPARIEDVRRVPERRDVRTVVPGVDQAVERAAVTARSFAEQGLTWATPGRELPGDAPLPLLP